MNETNRSRAASSQSEVADQSDLTPTITREKVLSKLCFAVYGKNIEEYHVHMMNDLYQHLVSIERKPVTRQAIRYWFKKGSIPSRNSALIFLNSYLVDKMDGRIESLEITVDQKKVYNQLRKFFRKSILDKPTNAVGKEITERLIQGNNIHVLNISPRKILIDAGSEEIDPLDVYDDVSGTFILYRVRMAFSGEKYIAREVVQIIRKGKEVIFRQWYLFQGVEISKFDGVVSVIGSSLWFIGASHRNENRLRIIKFRYVKHANRELRNMKWGIMLSDVPISGGFEPCSCKVLLIKAGVVINDIELFCRTTVKNIAPRDIEERIRPIVLRMIDNNITSVSLPNSALEIKASDGDKVTDSVLRTNQETLENAIMSIFKT